MTLAHHSSSILIRAANSSGELAISSKPRSSRRFCTSGIATVFTTSAWSRPTIAWGLDVALCHWHRVAHERGIEGGRRGYERTTCHNPNHAWAVGPPGGLYANAGRPTPSLHGALGLGETHQARC